MSSKIYENSGYGFDLNLLIILYEGYFPLSKILPNDVRCVVANVLSQMTTKGLVLHHIHAHQTMMGTSLIQFIRDPTMPITKSLCRIDQEKSCFLFVPCVVPDRMPTWQDRRRDRMCSLQGNQLQELSPRDDLPNFVEYSGKGVISNHRPCVGLKNNSSSLQKKNHIELGFSNPTSQSVQSIHSNLEKSLVL
jgi:hypothetical protein